jgi:hypothetical protein
MIYSENVLGKRRMTRTSARRTLFFLGRVLSIVVAPVVHAIVHIPAYAIIDYKIVLR